MLAADARRGSGRRRKGADSSNKVYTARTCQRRLLFENDGDFNDDCDYVPTASVSRQVASARYDHYRHAPL